MAICLKGRGRVGNVQGLTAAEVFNRWIAISGLLLFLAFTFWVTPGKMSFVSCPFKTLTGLNCPACGLTHSFCAIAQMQWRQAFLYHFFGPILFAGAGGLSLVWLGELFQRRKFAPAIRAPWRRRSLAILLSTWLLYWLWRIIPTVI
jgi:hypothetical protein